MDLSSPAFRIGELARRTGVGVPTLRAWELRYRLLRPARTAGGQRLYSVEDERRVRAVQDLVRSGVAVGAAARSIASGQTELAEPLGASSLPPSAARTPTTVADPRTRVRLATAPDDVELLLFVNEVYRGMLHSATPADVAATLHDFVRRLGATLVDAQIDDAVLPVDLSFGEGEPVLPRAEPMSLTRLRLELALPTLIEDARRVIELLRGQRGDSRRRP